LRRHKTLARKAQEVVYTWWLETTLGKDRILEMYLNVVEFGPRVYGIGAASRYYFQRDAAGLNAAQAAFLASVLPAPYRAHREVAAAGALPAELAGQIRGLLRRMAAAGRLSPDQLRVALAQVAELHPATGSPPPAATDDSGETEEAT
jgi:membrane peptidoglycan carboxypeptidase